MVNLVQDNTATLSRCNFPTGSLQTCTCRDKTTNWIWLLDMCWKQSLLRFRNAIAHMKIFSLDISSIKNRNQEFSQLSEQLLE